MMEKTAPSYYSILPAPVRYDHRLIPNAKILYAEITSLTNQIGFCYASNRYFEELYRVSTQSINTWLQQLEKYGYIERVIYRNKGTKEILNRYIIIFEKPTQINLNRPIKEILRDNSKALNTKPNNFLKRQNGKVKNVNPRKNGR